MEKIGCVDDAAAFAPDYGEEVDEYLVDAAMRLLDPSTMEAIRGCCDRGIIPLDTKRVLLRDLILHGLAEIFDPSLTPLGLAVRRRIQ